MGISITMAEVVGDSLHDGQKEVEEPEEEALKTKAMCNVSIVENFGMLKRTVGRETSKVRSLFHQQLSKGKPATISLWQASCLVRSHHPSS